MRIKTVSWSLTRFRIIHEPVLTKWLLSVVLMHYYSVEKSIFEIGLGMPTSLAGSDWHDFQRLETLHACLKASQALFEAFLSLPVSIARYLSFFTYTQMGHTLVVLHKLSTFECKDWDLSYVRETLDFGRTLDELIGWFERVVAAEELERGSLAADDIFSRTVMKLGRIRTRYQQNRALSSSTIGTSSNMPDINLALAGASMETFNEAWLEQLLGPWDFQYNAEIP